MRICVFGAGAVGGVLAHGLALAGEHVSLIARGHQLAALRRDGLRVGGPASLSDEALALPASESAAELGEQDVVILAVKGPALPSVARNIAPLLGAETTIVTAMNGVPWWMFARGNPSSHASLRALDPEGNLERAIPRERIVGCVLHLSASVATPGVIHHAAGRGLIVGDPSGGVGVRAAPIASALECARFDVTRSDSIERDLWAKLLGNASFNPVSVLTGASADRMISEPGTRTLLAAIIDECIAIGRSIGIEAGLSAAQRIDVARALGAFRTSMLQDWDGGRPLETDVLVDAPLEIAERMGIDAPMLRMVAGMVRLQVEFRAQGRSGR